MLRRTLVRFKLLSKVDRQLSTVFPNVEVSDTTADAQRTIALAPKIIRKVYYR
mgnify:CR=1 FL=1